MPIDLPALLDPRHTALLMMECQEGIIGDGGKLGALADAVKRHGTVAQIARVQAKRWTAEVGPWRAYLPVLGR